MSTDKPVGDPGRPGNGSDAVVLRPLARPPSGGLKLQHLMLAVAICALFIWITLVAGLWLLTGSLILLGACVVGLAVVLVRRTSTQQESLLWALAIAAERGLPLAPAALAFTEQFGGGFRWRAEMLAALLEEGKSLPEAVDAVPGLFTREAQVLVKTGWSSGRLAEALRLAASARQSRQAAWGNVAGSFAYLVAVICFMQTIIGFVLYFIIPKFEAIFKDFGISLPLVTILVIKFSHFVIQYFYIWFLLGILLLIALPLGVLNLFRWDVPLFDRLYRRRHSALLLRSLALTVKGGKPIATGIARLGEEYPSSWVRDRLREVNLDVQQGGDWVESLRGHGLISRAEGAVLASSQRVGNLEWALEEMAASAERRLGYRLQFWLNLLFPVAILTLGLLVFVVAVAFFAPLVSLISRLSG